MRRKWIAGGNIAEGFLVFANVGSGVVTFGNVAHGLFAFGNLAIGGVVAVGNVAVAPIALGGTNAVGVVAFSFINALPFVWGMGMNLLPPWLGFVVALGMLGATFVVKGKPPKEPATNKPVVDVESIVRGGGEGWVEARSEDGRLFAGARRIDLVPDLPIDANEPAVLAHVHVESIAQASHDYRDVQPMEVRVVCTEYQVAPPRPLWWETRAGRYAATKLCWRVALSAGVVAWILRLRGVL